MVQKRGDQLDEVNPVRGDKVSNLLYQAVVASYNNRPGAVVELHPAFRGVRVLRPDYKPIGCFESLDSDGTGTKIEIAERLADHSTIAYDLFAMIVDDAVVKGGETVAVNTVLDVSQLLENDALTERAIKQLAEGYVGAAKQARVVILGGETAELIGRIDGHGPFNYSWCGTGLWYAHPDRLLTGDKIKVGDKLVGFAEPGFRSNGLSDVRRTLKESYGEQWHNKVVSDLDKQSLGQLVQVPSTIYSGLMIDLTGGFDITKKPKAQISGAAHITGGGQKSKLKDMLAASGLGLLIDNPIEPPKIMLHVQKRSGYSDEKAYSKWHMGPGMVVATPEPEKVLSEAKKHDIYAQIIGEVTNDKCMRILNKGVGQENEWLEFPIA